MTFCVNARRRGLLAYRDVVIDSGEVVRAVEGCRKGHPDHGIFWNQVIPDASISGCYTICPISRHRVKPHCFLEM